MLAKVRLRGYNVHCGLAPSSASLECLSHRLLWFSSESTDVIIQIINRKYQTCLILLFESVRGAILIRHYTSQNPMVKLA